MKKNSAGESGFSLIEMMVTVGVSALILSLGVPGFQGLIRDNRMTTQYNQLVAGLNMARSEAVKRGVNVAMCKRNADGSDCNNGADWEDGWIVFTDFNNDGDVDLGDGEAVLRVHQALNENTTLRGGPANDRITYNSQGFTVGLANSTFSFCDDRGAGDAKGLIISPGGRARRAVDTDNDGIVEDGSANAIACP